MSFREIVWVRGAGELASAAAVTLQQAGFRCVLTEIPIPLCIRRTVSFSDVVFDGKGCVEGVSCELVYNWYEAERIWEKDIIPLFIDSEGIEVMKKQPEILVDARMLKKDLPDQRSLAEFMIGLGPGFHGGKNCHTAIETHRGHNLGRIYWNEATAPDTKLPGDVAGENARRVIRSPGKGTIQWKVSFGEIVTSGQTIGLVSNGSEVKTEISGMVRGLISPRVHVCKDLKIADIDPRGEQAEWKTISDKARLVSAGVLLSILIWRKRWRK
jgi:xanthine dehydrogenase accessory factor